MQMTHRVYDCMYALLSVRTRLHINSKLFSTDLFCFFAVYQSVHCLLGVVDGAQRQAIEALARQVNSELKALFLAIGLTLVDFKIELGLTASGELVVADEISPDTCRLWDVATTDSQERILDKDRFRQDLGGVVEAYGEVLKRVQGACPTPRSGK